MRLLGLRQPGVLRGEPVGVRSDVFQLGLLLTLEPRGRTDWVSGRIRAGGLSALVSATHPGHP